jgi:Zn-dependent protease
MLLSAQANLTTTVIAFIVMVMALIFHNIVQAFVADKLGDPSPRLAGFMAFDPQRQLDIIGVVFLLLLGFGWPRTVPVNSRNYKKRGRHEGWVWLSGVGAYLLVAFVSLLIAAIFLKAQSVPLFRAFQLAATTALLHAVINLFPLLPLDMARAALAWGNPDVRRLIMQIARFGVLGFIVFFFLLSATGVINRIMAIFGNLFIRIIGLIPGL